MVVQKAIKIPCECTDYLVFLFGMSLNNIHKHILVLLVFLIFTMYLDFLNIYIHMYHVFGISLIFVSTLAPN